MSNGGKPVLRRIMNAYGFTLQKQLCELLGISSGTVSTWIRRNYFRGNVVVTCSLDTGVSLKWLATGKGSLSDDLDELKGQKKITRKNLTDGVLQDSSELLTDLSFLPKPPMSPLFIVSSFDSWIVDEGVISVSNGRWLLGVDGKYDIYDVAPSPGKKIIVNNINTNFNCSISDVKFSGKIVATIDSN